MNVMKPLGKNTRVLKSEHHNKEVYSEMWSDLISKEYWQD